MRIACNAESYMAGFRDAARRVRACAAAALLLGLLLALAGCGRGGGSGELGTVVFLIESTPANLDPRIGTDAQSQYLDSLLFSSLVQRDEKMNLVPDLAASWEAPDPRTYIFHLRRGVRFHNGQQLVAADVKYTFDSLLSGAVESAKRGTFAIVERVDAPDDATVIFHLREPSTSFLWNLSRPAVGIVPRPGTPGGAVNPAIDPIGTGPFRFVRAVPDEEVVLERNPDYFAEPPTIERVRFRIVPDATTRALELRKGTADIALNSFAPDTVAALARVPGIVVQDDPGSHLAYLAFNLDDSILRHRRVRQALAYATDRKTLIEYLLRGQARLASSLLPPNHLTYDPNLPRYDYDPARAERLLDEAGFRRGADGAQEEAVMRFCRSRSPSGDRAPLRAIRAPAARSRVEAAENGAFMKRQRSITRLVRVPRGIRPPRGFDGERQQRRQQRTATATAR